MTEDRPPSGRDLLAVQPVIDPTILRVTIVDVNMSIGSLVVLMLKLAIAAIPAGIIIAVLSAILMGVLSGIMRS